MQLLRAVVALLLVAAPAAGANPLAAVLELLDQLGAKINKQGAAEEKAYHEFVEWCDDAAKNTKFDLQTAQNDKAKLEATIGKSTGDAAASASKIEELAGAISSDEGELKAGTEVREKEFKDYASSETELMESIDVLTRAISTLEREAKKNPSLAQVDISSANGLITSLTNIVDAAALASADKQKLMALVQSQQANDGSDDDVGAPAAAAYKNHGSSIIDVLEDLKEKAEEELGSLRKAETNAKHNFDMLKQSLEDQMAAGTKDMNDEKAAKATAEETKASAEGDLANAVKDIADGTKRLEVATSHCMQVAADHEATLVARKEELEVLAQAKEALTSSSSGAEQKTYTFVQVSGQVSGQAQVTSKLHTRADLASIEVVTLVKRLAKKEHSAALAQLASRINAVLRFGSGAGEDPFAKVKSMISDMIGKLETEAGSEATEKAYCDEQMSKTDAKKQELDADLAQMTAKIDQAASASATLKAEVQQLQSELGDLTKSQAVMDTIRLEEHSIFVETKADLEAGLEGVRKALGMLREYYGSGAAAAMLQASDEQPPVPEKHSKAGGAGSSIIGILEVVESDFAKNLATAETEEDDSQTEYDSMTQQNKITDTIKEQDVKYKTQEFKSLDKTVADLGGERETTNTELSAVLEYDTQLKARCIAQPETYEERKGRREAEISGLKDALRILDDETAFVQSRKHGGRKHSFLGL